MVSDDDVEVILLKLISKPFTGYKFHFPNQNLVSLWSASNYCGRTNNSAAILHLDSDMQQTFKTFAGIEEPVPENYPPPMPYFI